jgi:hypothetical protein
VFEFVDSIPKHKRALNFKWVFKAKLDNTAGKTVVSRYKARLTAQGQRQVYGEDFWETYAPCIPFVLVRMFLSIAASKRHTIHVVDIKTAYLNGVLDEEIYGRVPEGMKEFAGGSLFMRILRSLYGLRQSGRIWAILLQTTLKGFELIQCEMDVCLFTKELANGTVFVLFHVDDIIISVPENEESYMAVLKSQLLDRFKGTDCGEIKQFLNIVFDYDQNKGIISLSLKHYIEEALKTLDLRDVPLEQTPMDEDYVKDQILHVNSPLCDKTRFQKLIGTLIYISTSCRPDISAATLILARSTASPQEVHMVSAIKIFGYLKRTSHKTLKLGTMPEVQKLAFCDSDHAGSTLPKDELKSRTGSIVFVNGGAVSWTSKIQSITTSSSSHAEFIAMFSTTETVNYIVDVLTSTGQDDGKPAPLFNDNSSANTIMKSEALTGKGKHFRLTYLCARQYASTIACIYKRKSGRHFHQASWQGEVQLFRGSNS